MRLEAIAVVTTGGPDAEATLTGPGTLALGPLEVGLERLGVGATAVLRWWVANRGDRPVSPRSVRLRMLILDTRGPLRMFRHGYQSWSASGVATLGRDRDPSAGPRVPRLVRAMHHADEEPAATGELRSEAVTVLADDGPEVLLVGFLGGRHHDGTLRLRPATTPGGPATLDLEAFLGGARLEPASRRQLHDVMIRTGERPSALLESWATEVGDAAGARTAAPYQVGWCSWYHYFSSVTEADVMANLARAGDWPFSVFQIDDGHQRTIGDWLARDPSFPRPLDRLADDIAAAGCRPGLWLAPFLARPDAAVVRGHPERVARFRDGRRPLVGTVNRAWGGQTLALDPSEPGVAAWLTDLARQVGDAGFGYLKLDFTYAPSLDGVWADPTRTPAERVRAGYDAIRAGAGEDAFLLGCGAPLGATVGAVDGMRIGADVAPSWHLGEDQWSPGDYRDAEPATVNAWGATLTRSFQHRRLWLNDPDCLMLRTTETSLTPAQVGAWARAVGVSGGMALVSDDLSRLDHGARALLDEVIALGRAADRQAVVRGHPARCADLLENRPPTRLAGGGATLTGDPGTGTADLDH